jgi:hypothetical protein
MRIDVRKTLDKMGACNLAKKRIPEEFGKKPKVTRKNLESALRGWGSNWLEDFLAATVPLPDKFRRSYKTALNNCPSSGDNFYPVFAKALKKIYKKARRQQ